MPNDHDFIKVEAAVPGGLVAERGFAKLLQLWSRPSPAGSSKISPKAYRRRPPSTRPKPRL
jgi:hypothetical protein